MRLRFPDGFDVKPHWHTQIEHVTVISGTLHFGMGEKFDRAKTQPMPAGSFGFWPIGMKAFRVHGGRDRAPAARARPVDDPYVNPADDRASREMTLGCGRSPDGRAKILAKNVALRRAHSSPKRKGGDPHAITPDRLEEGMASRARAIAREGEGRDPCARCARGERRRLPRVRIDKDYTFEDRAARPAWSTCSTGAASSCSITSCSDRTRTRGARLLDGHRPGRPPGPLNARDTSFAIVSRAPIAKIEAYRSAWAGSFRGSRRSRAISITTSRSDPSAQTDEDQDGETFGLSVFVRDGEEVYRTYFTAAAASRRSARSGPSSI